ncbi:MAG: alpha/beta fold hydrolase [Deltaproteobacteria bacterium]|nr:alpha/beta fold hydrolase [Deltaproteobacteria bacterium]
MRKWLAPGLVAVVIAWYGLAPLGFGGWHHALEGTPADLGVAFETVTFQPRDQPLLLRGWSMQPAGARGALVMVHGGGNNRSQLHNEWLKLAAALTQRGYGVLSIDLRNHGESGDTALGPTFGPDEANDVIGAVDLLRRRDPALPVGAIGFSMGGQTAIYAAAADPRLQAVVSDATYTDTVSITPAFAHASTGLPAWLFGAPFLWSAQHLHGLQVDRARAVDVIGALAPRPVLLIHDVDDPIVPVEQARALAGACKSAELWVTSTPPEQLPERMRGRWGTHAQSYALQPDAYATRVAAFFDRAFAAPPPS